MGEKNEMININIWCLFCTDHSGGWQSNIFYQTHHISILSFTLPLQTPFDQLFITHLSCESVGWLDEQRWSIPLV